MPAVTRGDTTFYNSAYILLTATQFQGYDCVLSSRSLS